MSIENYLMINQTTNVVENVCLWDGDNASWNPPEGFLVLRQESTPSEVWVWNDSAKDYELSVEIGMGGIGFTWDGEKCITNRPKPEFSPVLDQPFTSGTQTL